MSIASMTEVAFQSRTDVGRADFVPRTLQQVAGAAAGHEEPATSVNTALRTLTTYIPTETLTLYVAILATLGAPPDARDVWITFWCFLVATPLIIWITFATKLVTAQKPIPASPLKWPLWELCAGTAAYVAWAWALPSSPLPIGASKAVSGIVVLVVSTGLGLLAPLFARPLKP